MREVALFVEDSAHHQFLGALIHRVAAEHAVPVKLRWQNVRHGHGAVLKELRQYLRDLERDRRSAPDLIVVATDANCKGLVDRLNEVKGVTEKFPVRIICAVPDPHIERWLLLDSSAFKTVFGRGCDAPDLKCERGRYKKMLIDAIRSAGITPSLGGLEFADDIVDSMDLEYSAKADDSLGYFLDQLQAVFREWQT